MKPSEIRKRMADGEYPALHPTYLALLGGEG